jgi:hypothetical protein
MNIPEIKKSSRSGRYRKLLIAPEELTPFASKLEALFNDLQIKRQTREISDAEFLSYGLLALLACRRIDAFQKNPGALTQTIANRQKLMLIDFFLLLKKYDLPNAAFKKFTELNGDAFDFLKQIRFRGIPDSARQALLQWLEKKYPLHLFLYIPTVGEVFNMQKWGGRCVSFFIQSKDIIKLHHDRDVISFIVHDLIHAHEFYSNQERANQQIGFYQWLDEIKDFSEIQNLISKSKGFRERWEYLLSDMNSYCGHLLKTLHAAIIIHVPNSDNHVLWKSIVEKSSLSESDRILFLKINSFDWVDEDYLALETIFDNKFKKITR